MVFVFTTRDGKIAEINMIADPERLRHTELVFLDA